MGLGSSSPPGHTSLHPRHGGRHGQGPLASPGRLHLRRGLRGQWVLRGQGPPSLLICADGAGGPRAGCPDGPGPWDLRGPWTLVTVWPRQGPASGSGSSRWVVYSVDLGGEPAVLGAMPQRLPLPSTAWTGCGMRRGCPFLGVTESQESDDYPHTCTHTHTETHTSAHICVHIHEHTHA